jgi:hypothetical protein
MALRCLAGSLPGLEARNAGFAAPLASRTAAGSGSSLSKSTPASSERR